ncbi:MAG: HEAT repeat domain-containing protein [Polyangiaceae bacterium]|nr:HEAT repeat domain-containing protein [Polyangiaceae bacterium]
MKKHVFVVALLGAMMAQVSPVNAAPASGVMLAPDKLPANARTALALDIEAAKRQSPKAFQALSVVRNDLPRLDANKRGRFAPIPAILKSMGKDALLPMLEELAFRGQPKGELTDSAWIAWRAGVIEAVGMLRDARAESVLVTILDGSETEFHVVRAAAAALGRIGTDTAAQKLVTMSKLEGAKRKAVLAGMGECRRKAVAVALADVAIATPDAATAKIIAHSLGDVGSAWAWKTSIIASSGEEAPVRAIAAKALVAVFVAHDGDARKTASNALMVVDDPSTPALIDAAKKGASRDLAAALDALAARFARNPTR